MTNPKLDDLTRTILKRCKDRIEQGEHIPKELSLYSLKRKWL